MNKKALEITNPKKVRTYRAHVRRQLTTIFTKRYAHLNNELQNQITEESLTKIVDQIEHELYKSHQSDRTYLTYYKYHTKLCECMMRSVKFCTLVMLGQVECDILAKMDDEVSEEVLRKFEDDDHDDHDHDDTIEEEEEHEDEDDETELDEPIDEVEDDENLEEGEIKSKPGELEPEIIQDDGSQWRGFVHLNEESFPVSAFHIGGTSLFYKYVVQNFTKFQIIESKQYEPYHELANYLQHINKTRKYGMSFAKIIVTSECIHDESLYRKLFHRLRYYKKSVHIQVRQFVLRHFFIIALASCDPIPGWMVTFDEGVIQELGKRNRRPDLLILVIIVNRKLRLSKESRD